MAGTNGINGTGAEQLVGRVEATNERGLKINGEWKSYSKWAEDLVPPTRGSVVALTLDGRGFIRRVAPAEGTADVAGAGNGYGAVTGRDATITRLAVLKAAAEWSAGRQEVKSADVLKIAERWERWVTRGEG